MKIVLASPLYPPDTAMVAVYIKELAGRLATEHEVTIVAYGRHPEKIENVHIVAVSKQQPLPIRLIAFFIALLRASRGADALIVENGGSVELPAGVLARMSSVPILVHRGDTDAHRRATAGTTLGHVAHFLESRARAVLDDTPLSRPEVLPFQTPPDMTAYEASWKEHVALLTHHLHV